MVWYRKLDYRRAAVFTTIATFFLAIPVVFLGLSLEIVVGMFCGAVGAKWLIFAMLLFDMASAIEKLESGDSENTETQN